MQKSPGEKMFNPDSRGLLMKRELGFTFIELLIVVTIIGVLSAIAIPMYRDNVRRSKVGEAVDTIGAMKDEIGTYVSERGFLPPRCDNHNEILATNWGSSPRQREMAISNQE